MKTLQKDLIDMVETFGGKKKVNDHLKKCAKSANNTDRKLINEMIKCFNHLYAADKESYIKDYTVDFRAIYKDTLDCLYRMTAHKECVVLKFVIDVIDYKLDRVSPKLKVV